MLNNQTPRKEYTGNGVLTTFAYDFPILSKSYIKVYVDSVLKTVDTDYSVTGVGVAAGGNIVFVSAPANAKSVVFLRSTPVEQLLHYINNDAFPANTAESALDKIMMILQEIKEQLGRIPAFAIPSLFDSVTLPDPEEGLFLGWLSDQLANLSLGTARNEESVSASAGGFNVVFDSAQANADYLILSLTANWATTLEWSAKLTTGFSVTFGTPAPSGAKLVWSILAQ